MKTFFFLIISLSLSFSLDAQKKAPLNQLDLQRDGKFYQVNHIEAFTGVAYEDYENGKKKSRAEFKGGRLNGKVTIWHKTGEKSSQIHYKDGIRVGTEYHWYPTGVKKLEINYDEKGLPTGICKEYFDNGSLKSEGKYLKGREEGLHKWYFLNGNLDQTVQYVDGLANGKVKHYYKNKKMKMNADYKDGEPHGMMKLYYEDGSRKRETNYSNGKEHGKDLLWSKKNILLEERKYENGEEIVFKNYRSGAIKTKKGFIQVFNEKNSFFTIHLNKGWIRSRASRDITYVIDQFVLQLFNTPISEFYKGEEEKTTQKILELHLKYEQDIIEKATQSQIDIRSTFIEKSGTLPYLKWSFESPTLKDVKNPSSKTVVKEHYLTFVCHQQILTLYVPQTKGNNEKDIINTLSEIIKTIEIRNARIDLNQLRQEIRENAGLPPLPVNETIKGYKKNPKKSEE